MYLTGYSDYLTDFREPLSPPYKCHTSLRKNRIMSMLSASDFRFKDCIFHSSPEASAEELRRFQQASDRDWIKFLLPRARELKQGKVNRACTRCSSGLPRKQETQVVYVHKEFTAKTRNTSCVRTQGVYSENKKHQLCTYTASETERVPERSCRINTQGS